MQVSTIFYNLFLFIYSLSTADIDRSSSFVNKSKIRRRTANPAELLFGHQIEPNIMSQSHHESNMLRPDHALQRIPSVPGSLKLVNISIWFVEAQHVAANVVSFHPTSVGHYYNFRPLTFVFTMQYV